MNNSKPQTYLTDIKESKKQNKISRIHMTPANNSVVGEYHADASNVHITLDSSNSPFSVELPALGVSLNTTFWFYNIPKSGSGNNVTITGRKINNTTAIILAPGDGATITDGNNESFLALIMRS